LTVSLTLGSQQEPPQFNVEYKIQTIYTNSYTVRRNGEVYYVVANPEDLLPGDIVTIDGNFSEVGNESTFDAFVKSNGTNYTI